jgi:hypothetical protein
MQDIIINKENEVRMERSSGEKVLSEDKLTKDGAHRRDVYLFFDLTESYFYVIFLQISLNHRFIKDRTTIQVNKGMKWYEMV